MPGKGKSRSKPSVDQLEADRFHFEDANGVLKALLLT